MDAATTPQVIAVAPLVEPAKPTVPTLAEFLETYLASARLDNAHSTVEAKEDKLRLHILPHLGDLRLDQIDYAVIDDFRVKLSRTRNAKVKVREQWARHRPAASRGGRRSPRARCP